MKSRRLDAPAGMQRDAGLLFAQIEETRRRTRELVMGMPTGMLDARPLADRGFGQSIGALLVHLAGAERFWMHRVVGGRPIDDHERAVVDDGHPVAFYLGKLDEARAATEALFWGLGADALDAECEVRAAPFATCDAGPAAPAPGDRPAARWIVHFLIDHEAHHRGEMRLLAAAARSLR